MLNGFPDRAVPLLMIKVLFAAFLILVLAADWAALHDIIKGEPEVWQESLFVLASALLFMSLSVRGLWVKRRS